jgi:hypothetical protein
LGLNPHLAGSIDQDFVNLRIGHQTIEMIETDQT